MNLFFQKYSNSIENYLKNFLLKRQIELSDINKWGKDLMERFADFSLHGKMIRGGLIILSYQMFTNDTPDLIIQIASALELIHSSLLIHDDIIDRDNIRRGKKTLFYQYKELGEHENHTDSYHFGESLGICAGDIGFFLAFEILSKLETTREIKEKVLSLWSKELTFVSLAQMQDCYFSISIKKAGEEEILNLYRYKTARYTFSLPLMTGAIAAGQDSKTILQLEKLGENLGIIFQIKDDEIGLFGNESEIGKPVGTDIKEGKKTLYSLYLSEITMDKYREKIRTIFNQKKITPSTLLCLREIAEKSGVRDKIHNKMLNLKEKAESLITSLSVDNVYKDVLSRMLQFNMERTR